jgi:tape measure domain-containing protein
MAAQDAELKLKVSLDLAFFRQQLTGLGQAAAGTPFPVQIRFDRRGVQNELNALGANIRRRNYTLNVNTNLKAEIDNASKLAKALDELGRSRSAAQQGINQQLGLGQLLKGPQSGGLGSKDVERLYRAAARAGILEYSKEVARTKASAVAALEAVGSDSVRGLLNGLKGEDEKLRAAAEYLGESLIKTVKNVLGIASPSREFKKIGQNVGEGFQQGVMSSMDKAFDAVEGLMRARMKVLDTIARGMFRMAGVDPAAIRAEASQRRALPGVNFPATVPSRNIPIGPSGTGRALPPGAIPSALPGTAFGAQKYLPTDLGVELQKILRGAAFAFIDSLKQQTRNVRLGLGAVQQPLLAPGRIAGLLPAGVGRAPSVYSTGAISGETREEMMARREREARMRSALRGLDVMGGGAGRAPSPYSYAYRGARPTSAIVPYAAGGAIVPQPSMAGGDVQPPSGGGRFGGFGGMIPGAGNFGRAIGGVNLPGTGTIRELGEEFGFATKQVVLFGQAYKLLAFIQNLPSQVGAAVGQLQSFRNTLQAVTPSAEEARASNALLLGLMEKYNVPLQSARDGFTKLYASMAPAGFSGDEIRDLFTGITKAAATFGMSADKVDRVNYAFAQMASKGQVMSEELKGQLGDVLPGAMALFAEAAGFKGPKAIQDFSAALEDGAYKGEAMVALLKNVTVVMNKEFGPGAEGAALTFQGVMNRMQNSMTLFYEAFEPVAVGFLNTVVVPMTNGIKQLTDGLNAFFTGTAAKTAGGFAFAQELESLRPAFDGIGQNVAAFMVQLGDLAKVGLEVGKIFLQIAGNPIVGYLAKLYAIALPINIALNVMRGLWAANAVQLLIFNTRVATGTSTLAAFRGMMAATGATAQATATSIRTAGITLRAFFATTGVGLVVVGISMLIEKFLSMNQALEETKAKALGAAQAIRAMSQTEARAAEQEAQTAYQTIGALAGRQGPQQAGGDRLIPVNERELKQLQSLGAIREQRDPGGQIYVRRSEALSLAPQAQRLQSEAAFRQRQIKFDEQQARMPAVLGAMPSGEGDGKTKKGKELDQYIQDASKALDIEKERQLLAIEDRMLRGEISEMEAKRQSLLIEKLYEEKSIKEALRVAEIKLKEENLSAADKDLKLIDLRTEANQKLANVRQKFGVETLKVELALQKPLEDAIAGVNEQLDEQAMIRENISGGIRDLTYDQKAQLDVQKLTKDLTDAEKQSVTELIDEYRRKREEYYKNEEALRRQQAILEAMDDLQSIGTGLRAGYAGSAASVFERTMVETQGDVGYATKLADIETKAMILRSVFDGLQGAIQGVSSAFASMMTEGVTALVTGTASAKEIFANFLQAAAQALQQAAAQMIATYIAIGIAKMFAGLGGAASTGGSAGGVNVNPATNTIQPLGSSIPGLQAAKGAYFNSGMSYFATGGIVSSPTFFKFADGGKINMGLMGEAGPEAIMPLKRGPDGRLGISMYDASRKAVANAENNAGVSSVDYEDDLSMGDGSASRQSVSARAAQATIATRLQVMEQRSISEKRSEMRQIEEMISAPARINVEYQSQVINNVEYVTREQAERMASQSALRGRELAIGALQNSVKTRKRVGMG